MSRVPDLVFARLPILVIPLKMHLFGSSLAERVMALRIVARLATMLTVDIAMLFSLLPKLELGSR
jgi:hypothetical protein